MALEVSVKKISQYLLDKDLVSQEQLNQLLSTAARSDFSLEEAIIEKKIFTSEKFCEIKGDIFNLPTMDLANWEADPAVLNLLSLKVANNYKMVIFDRSGNEIKIGLADPGDFQAHEAIEFLVQQNGFETKYFAISLADFRKVFGQYGDFKKEIGTALESAKEKFFTEEKIGEIRATDELEQVIKAAPVAKIVSVIIKHAIDGKASDIHIEPGREEARIRYRVDGVLHTTLALPTYLHNAVVSRIKVLANLKLDETRLPQDGRIRVTFDNQIVDLRVSVLPMLDAEKVVMRLLDTSAGVPTLSELGFSAQHIAMMERNIKRPHGMFLLTGPTGSGKTTTLYSLLNMLNSENMNITTLEDPIEYYITGINQSQIRADIDFTFAKGLRAILRQDPNIIMVGEIRDVETAELVIHASLTGHLVFSTLHTNDAWGAVPRLIDMKVEPFLLASTLNLVMAQRLVRRVCPDCRAEMKLPENMKKRMDEEIKNIPAELLKEFSQKNVFFAGKGCTNCANSGYVGRLVVSEMMEIDTELRSLIAGDFNLEMIRAALKKQNFITLTQDAIIKALKGQTTVEEVLRVSQE